MARMWNKSSTLRVKKQRPSRICKTTTKATIFIAKPTPRYVIPLEVEELLGKYISRNNLDLRTLSNVKKKNKKHKTVVNGFTAFRTYYSKFGKTYEDQENLSKELANLWKQTPSIQSTWRGYSEEYRASETDLPFVEWFDTYKSLIKPEPEKRDYITQTTTMSHLTVEDVYDNLGSNSMN